MCSVSPSPARRHHSTYAGCTHDSGRVGSRVPSRDRVGTGSKELRHAVGGCRCRRPRRTEPARPPDRRRRLVERIAAADVPARLGALGDDVGPAPRASAAGVLRGRPPALGPRAEPQVHGIDDVGLRFRRRSAPRSDTCRRITRSMRARRRKPASGRLTPPAPMEQLDGRRHHPRPPGTTTASAGPRCPTLPRGRQLDRRRRGPRSLSESRRRAGVCVAAAWLSPWGLGAGVRQTSVRTRPAHAASRLRCFSASPRPSTSA